MKRLLQISLLLVPLLAVNGVKIKLKDGGVVRGKIVSENAKELIIANEYGKITIEKANIAKRYKQKSDTPSFANSTYSISKKSWPKYAFLGSLGVGIVVSTIFFDSIDPLGMILSFSTFGAMTLTFAGLDFFLYGRVPKKKNKKFNLAWQLPENDRNRVTSNYFTQLQGRYSIQRETFFTRTTLVKYYF